MIKLNAFSYDLIWKFENFFHLSFFLHSSEPFRQNLGK